MNSSPDETVTRHPLFYFNHGTFIFRVKNTLYKLYHPVLVEESDLFAGLFDIGSNGPATLEGQIDENPIYLDRDLTPEVFDMFIQFKFGR